MSWKVSFSLIIITVLTSCLASAQSKKPKVAGDAGIKLYQRDWHGVQDSTVGRAQVYGSYTAGCLDGAVKLPEIGVGFKAVSMLNNRSYGHPSLVNMIVDLGKVMSAEYHKAILIGDLGHARGGPASIETSAHRSHQTGLDVDMWYRNIGDREVVKKALYPTSVLSKKKNGLNKKVWNSTHAQMLKALAGFDDVERILVNPYVKKEMCANYKGAKWLNKLRPWWGHDKHFHVRLKCPVGDRYCKKQGAVQNDDGCGAPLTWWFSDEANSVGKKKGGEKRVYPRLPAQCEDVFLWEGGVESAASR